MSNLHDVFDRWANDSDFKLNFKKNPQQALELAGIELSPEDLHKVLATISKQEELEKKINK
ncbi:MAG: hypothetical protein ABI597_10310 [Gammaproteobacteria bacterium]